MKISAENMVVELLERMREAHELGGAARAGEAPASTAPRADPAPPGLDSRIVETARQVLAGDIVDATAAREAVLRHIVDDRLAGIDTRVAIDRAELIEGLSADPNMARELDEMLVFAAHRLGSTDG